MTKVLIQENIIPINENIKIIGDLLDCPWFVATDKNYPGDKLLNILKGSHCGFSFDPYYNFDDDKKLNDEYNHLINFAYKIHKNICDKQNYKNSKMMRIYFNMYYKNQNTEFHTDKKDDKYITILYNLHTTDGGTIVDNVFYEDKMGQAKIFKSNLLHKGIGPKTDKIRFNLNMIIKND